MSKLKWDQTGERTYETGVDHGVLYRPDTSGVYATGYAWNGLVSVTESPSGAEASPQYADNIKYLNLVSAEDFGATIEAFTYPSAFAECDGTATPAAGLALGQQERKQFGLAYRTKLGNDTDGADHGYKLHLIYGALAAPSEKAYSTVNDSPEALTFSWEVTTTPVDVPGFKPSASLTINSREVDAASLAELEDTLFGTAVLDPSLPLPGDVIALFEGTIQEVTPTEPAFDQPTNTITVPTVAGVVYTVNGAVVEGAVPITEDTLVVSHPDAGYQFPDVVDNDWVFYYVTP